MMIRKMQNGTINLLWFVGIKTKIVRSYANDKKFEDLMLTF